MSLNKGEVAFTVEGTTYTLVPSLTAFSQLSNEYSNYQDLLRKLASNNVPAIARVIRLGLGWNDQQSKKLPELMMRAGLAPLVEATSDYAFRLFNGGKSADEVLAEQAGETDNDKEGKAGAPFAG